MQKIDINNSVETSPSIIINYAETLVNNPQINNDQSGKSIIASFIGKLNNPNIIYSENSSTPKKYQSTKMYIYGKLHNINVDYDGELIIENQSITSMDRVFMVFLLKKSMFSMLSTTTNIDKIISNAGSTPLAINDIVDINTSKCIVYQDNNTSSIVIINTTVIPISTDISNYSTLTTLFSVNPAKYTVIQQSTQEGFQIKEQGRAGAVDQLQATDPNGDYMECENLDIDSPTSLQYQIPLSSSAMADTVQKNTSTTIVNYTVYLVMGILIFVGSPYFYRIIEIKALANVVEEFELKEYAIEYQQIKWWDILIFSMFLIPFIILVMVGFSTKQPNLTGGGIALAIAYMIGYISIKNDNMNHKNHMGGQRTTYAPLLSAPAPPSLFAPPA